jgi:hypothetical protein
VIGPLAFDLVVTPSLRTAWNRSGNGRLIGTWEGVAEIAVTLK